MLFSGSKEGHLKKFAWLKDLTDDIPHASTFEDLVLGHAINFQKGISDFFAFGGRGVGNEGSVRIRCSS